MAKFIEHKFVEEVHSLNGLRLTLSLSDPETVRLEFDGWVAEFQDEDIPLVAHGESDQEAELSEMYATIRRTTEAQPGLGWVVLARDWMYTLLVEFAEKHGIVVNNFS